jgi:membrane fusion protein (multidrug efflux system)
MNKRFLIVIAVIAVAAAAAYYFVETKADDGGAAMPVHGQGAQAVSVMQLKTQTVSLSRALPGRISAFRQSQVRPQVNGIITQRLFEEGANVEKGQQLYQIDDARYEAALLSAQADLNSARSNIASVKARTSRYKDLVKIDAVSRQEYDDVKAQLDQANAGVAVAQAAVDVAQVNLDYTKVYAPISGRIGRSLVTEGALVTANQQQAMSVITQLDPIYVDMQQASGEAMALQQMRLEGQEEIAVTVMLGDNHQLAYPHEGSLKFSEVTINETTGSITLRARVPNPDNILMPGLFVRASLNIGDVDALLVPQRAATRNPDGTLNVWVVDGDNKAQSRAIEVKEAYQDSWIISAGLTDGDTIIVEGYQKVAAGAQVEPSLWLAKTGAQNSAH